MNSDSIPYQNRNTPFSQNNINSFNKVISPNQINQSTSNHNIINSKQITPVPTPYNYGVSNRQGQVTPSSVNNFSNIYNSNQNYYNNPIRPPFNNTNPPISTPISQISNMQNQVREMRTTPNMLSLNNYQGRIPPVMQNSSKLQTPFNDGINNNYPINYSNPQSYNRSHSYAPTPSQHSQYGINPNYNQNIRTPNANENMYNFNSNPKGYLNNVANNNSNLNDTNYQYTKPPSSQSNKPFNSLSFKNPNDNQISNSNERNNSAYLGRENKKFVFNKSII
jgi:hypothetical protein